MFRDTFNPYKPAVIDWPKLDAEARDRLVSLPIWDIAVQTEDKAGCACRPMRTDRRPAGRRRSS